MTVVAELNKWGWPSSPAGWLKHLNLLMCTCKYTLSLFPSHRLSHPISLYLYFSPRQVIYCFILLNIWISKIKFKEVCWPIWGSCWFIQMKWLFSNDLKSLIEKGNCHNFWMHLFVLAFLPQIYCSGYECNYIL